MIGCDLATLQSLLSPTGIAVSDGYLSIIPKIGEKLEEGDMTQLTLQMPESAFATLHQAPDEFVLEMRVAAAVKWYELGRVSQGRAAEIAGLTRAAFIDALSRYRVSPFQYTAEELIEELRDAD